MSTRRRLILSLTISLLSSIFATSLLANTQVNIAVLAFRPAPELQQRWKPLIDHLNESVSGYRFKVHALGYRDLEAAIARRSVDFVLTNPAHYVLMTYRNGLSSPLATLVPKANGSSLAWFGGVIIAKADKPGIDFIRDLKGHAIATVTKGSLGGFQAQAMELLEHEIRIPRDVSLIETGMPHDQVVQAVLSEKADAGFVRTGVLEDMTREGKLDIKQIKVIGPKRASGFPLLLSTRLYPEWPFSAMPEVDQELARKVAAELLSIPHDGELANDLGISGFTIPTDYEIVRSSLKSLRLPPFDSAPSFTLQDVWERYRGQILVGMALVTIIALLSTWSFLLNRQLLLSRRQMQRSAEEWHRLLTALGEGVYGVDRDGRCTFVNPAALSMLGFTREELLGKAQHELFHHHRRDGSHYPSNACPISLTLNDGVARNWEDWFWKKDGSGFPVMLTTAPTVTESGIQGTVVVFRDISEQQQKVQALQIEASTDPLTGLDNRRRFIERAEEEFSRYQRTGESASLIMLDIDFFKRVNDQHGHAVGDEVLKHFARITSGALRGSDVVGRLGGEEFGIMLPATGVAEAIDFAERHRRMVANTPARTEAGIIEVTVSLGLTEFHPLDESPKIALTRADQAMYQAKEKGRNRVEIKREDAYPDSANPTENAFAHLLWKDSYHCGQPQIDREHQRLFQLANTLLDLAADRTASTQQRESAFENLLEHLRSHFEHEEALLEQAGFADADEHAHAHQQLLSQCLQMQQKLRAGKLPMRELVQFLVFEVVAFHMLHEDRKFFAVFTAAEQTK